jgi:hypothetical protein
MAVTKITVPKTPKSAFNKNRPASGLLMAQLEHLEAAAGKYPPVTVKRRKTLTEAQVAARVQVLTRTLHPQSAHVPLPTARMIDHAEDTDPASGSSKRPSPKRAKKPSRRQRGHKTRGRG